MLFCTSSAINRVDVLGLGLIKKALFETFEWAMIQCAKDDIMSDDLNTHVQAFVIWQRGNNKMIKLSMLNTCTESF